MGLGGGNRRYGWLGNQMVSIRLDAAWVLGGWFGCIRLVEELLGFNPLGRGMGLGG